MSHLSMDGFHVMDHESWVDPVGSTPWDCSGLFTPPIYITCIDTPYTIHIPGWWLQTWLDYFPFHIWDVILPIDFHIFQRGGSTTNPETTL